MREFDTGLTNSKQSVGQIRNPTWHLGPQRVMSYFLVVLLLYILQCMNTQECKILLVFNLAGFLRRIMQ